MNTSNNATRRASAGVAGKITMPFPCDILQDIEPCVTLPTLFSVRRVDRSALAALNTQTCLRPARRDYAQAGKVPSLSSDVSSSPLLFLNKFFFLNKYGIIT